MKPRVILLSGASGFIGRHLLNRLLVDEGARIVVIGRRRPDALRDQDLFIECDLNALSAERLTKAGVGEVDTVFHLAAATPKNKEQANQGGEMMQANVEVTWKLLQALPRVTGRFVFASTLDVYRLPVEGKPITEETPIEPSTIYGATKVCAEHVVRIEAHRRQFAWTILRLGHVYGPGEEAYEKLIPTAIRDLLQGRSPIMFGAGDVLRDFLFVTDAVEAFLRSALAPTAVGQTVNIVSGHSVTLRKTLETLIQVSGRTVEIDIRGDQPSGVSFCFENTRMRRILGEWLMVPMKDGLQSEFTHAELIAAK